MQTSYSYDVPEAVHGMMSEDFTKYVDTTIPQVVVKTGNLLTADKTLGKVRNAAKLPTTAAEVGRPGAMGIVILDGTREGGFDWPAFRPTPAMRRGRIWLKTESAVLRWTYPFFRFAAGAGGSDLGALRGNADSATAAELQQALIITDADVGQLCLVEIDLF